MCAVKPLFSPRSALAVPRAALRFPSENSVRRDHAVFFSGQDMVVLVKLLCSERKRRDL